jgi:hypothetical protein
MWRRKHLLITGTGRAGTTFLVQLLTLLGLDTGIDDIWDPHKWNAHAKAGLEWNIQHPKAPYIIKGPQLSTELNSILRNGRKHIEHVLVPVRDLYSAAESRREVQRRSNVPINVTVPGGLTSAHLPQDQETTLALDFYELFETLAYWDIPHTLMSFPRLVNDPKYLFEKLTPFLGERDYLTFQAAFSEVAKPNWVHDFRQKKDTKVSFSYSLNGEAYRYQLPDKS